MFKSKERSLKEMITKSSQSLRWQVEEYKIYFGKFRKGYLSTSYTRELSFQTNYTQHSHFSALRWIREREKFIAENMQ